MIMIQIEDETYVNENIISYMPKYVCSAWGVGSIQVQGHKGIIMMHGYNIFGVISSHSVQYVTVRKSRTECYLACAAVE